MKNISWSQLNIILAIVMGTAILFGLIGGLASKETGAKPEMAEVESMNDAWIVKSDMSYDFSADLPCNLEIEKGTPVSISHYLPEDLGKDYGIAFRSMYNQVQVKVGDTILYQYGVDEKQMFVSSPVPKWNFVPIDSRYAGELITITQISEYGKYSGFFPTVQLGSRSALLYGQWKSYGWGCILSAVLFLMLLGMTGIAIVLQIQKKLDISAKYYLILAMCVILFSISGLPILSIYGNSYLLWFVHMITRMLIPIAYLLFLRSFVQKKRMVLVIDIGIFAAGICYAAVMILQLLGLLELAVTYDFLRMLYSIGFLVYTVLVLIGWLKYKKNELRMLAVENCLFVAAGIVNLFVRPNHMYQLEGKFWQICIMVYMFALLAAVLERILKQVGQQVNQVEQEYENQRAIAVMMMNPNFLFRALNTLLSMTKSGSTQSSKFVFAFSQYLRYNLDSVREDKLIPFEEELKHVTAYLDIQQLRMPDLQVVIEDKIRDIFVPCRTIEAIVENAVKYGISKKDNQGQIIIRSYERRDCYAVQIVDDGVGFDTDILYRKTTPTSMKRLQERLENSVGGRIEVSSKYQKGTIVTVKIPKTGSMKGSTIHE